MALADGSDVGFDLLVWVTGGVAPPLFRESGLETDSRGFVLTRPTLQVEGHDNLFAVGDCATLIEHPATAKAGVYAVREGPFLIDNLNAFLEGRELRRYTPQRDFLALLNLGDGTAVGGKWGLSFEGRWVMRLKDWIDRRFMRKFQVLAPAGEPAPEFPAMDDGMEMLCGGCAAKVGQSVLDRALARVAADAGAGGGGSSGRAAAPRTRPSCSDSRAPTTPRRCARRAATSSPRPSTSSARSPRIPGWSGRWPPSTRCRTCSRPASPLAMRWRWSRCRRRATATRPRRSCTRRWPARAPRSTSSGVTLLGGHTTTAAKLMVGFAVDGFAEDERRLMRLDRLRPGQVLVLTKALGTGVLFHADMRALARGPWLEAALRSVTQSNAGALSILRAAGVDAATDVTGFGLVGHLGEMLRASGCEREVEAGRPARLSRARSSSSVAGCAARFTPRTSGRGAAS